MQAEEQRATAIAAARAAGRLLREAWASGGPRRVDHKGAVDLVTELDVAAEAAVVAVLAERCPGVPVLAEEGGGAADADTRWIIDPLDGTTNFVHGLPHFAVSVALQADGVLLAGCVLDVVRDECWSAARGGGTTLDGRPMAVSRTAELRSALVGTGFPYDRRERAAKVLAELHAVMVRAQGVRRAGAAALDLAWVAGGRLDAFWEHGLAPWDVAAGALLVEEAGGLCTDMDGGPLSLDRPRILASNRLVHGQMRAVLAALISSSDAAP
ncbi:MAG: inositol monophosphatase [Alphaproteobacteria bacterium]|nr:inositol monophosphatase [Alphaproteobacteria bacterium]